MIILPDRNITRQTKYLKPIPRNQWYGPHPYGPDVNLHFQTWVAQAFRSDRSMVWHGHFEDRDDADAFMWALYSGTLKTDPYLKRLPVYCYTFDQRQIPIRCPSGFDPDMLDDLGIMYNMVTNIGIGPSSGTWTAPGDCYGLASRAGEFVDCIGPGGGGAGSNLGTQAGGGGGGGAARLYNLALSPSQGVSFGVGAGGGGGANASGAGGSAHTWFYSTVNPGVQGNAGGGGVTGNYPAIGTGGGGGGANAGAIGWAGGRGGQTLSVNPGSTACGGGGAAGPAGAGSQGGDTNTGGTATAGGAGNGGQIGANGTGNYYGPWGPGGGGNGVWSAANGNVGLGGGQYGGGGGAGCGGGSTSYTGYGAAGGHGLIVIRYEPQYAPAISSITPSSGPTAGGQAVTIGGSNFVSVTSANIGGAALTGLSVPSTTVINATTSAGGAGTYNVNVYRSGGPSPGVGANLYTYVAPPTVTGCNPPLGLIFGGTDVTISGTLMSGATGVTFGGVAATNVVVVNANTITCKTPAHANGLVDIAVTNAYGTGTGVGLFTYLLPASGFNMPMMGI